MHRIVYVLVPQSHGEKKTRRKLTKILMVPFRDMNMDDEASFFFLFYFSNLKTCCFYKNWKI